MIGGNPAPSLLWKLGDAWLEAESVSKEQEEGRVVSVVRLSLGRGDHGKVLQCQVQHPTLKETELVGGDGAGDGAVPALHQPLPGLTLPGPAGGRRP